MSVTIDSNFLVFPCLHCEHYIIVHKSDINCMIFHHGVLKSSLQQISPHTPQYQCLLHKEKDEIYGFGKPFSLKLQPDGSYQQIDCGYI